MTNRADTFNRADDASTLGTPSDSGGGYSVSASSTWGISSNRAYKVAPDITFDIAYLEASVNTVDAQATVVVVGNSGVVVRAADGSNFIMVQVLSGSMLLYKRVAGTFTQIGTTYTGTISNNDVIKLTVDGANLISAYQNGTLRKSGTDSAGSTNTKHGLMIHGVAGRWDDLTIDDNSGGGGITGPLLGGHLIHSGPLVGGRLVQ